MSQRDLVLGTALGYDYRKVATFVESLRATGYRGDVALIVSGLDPVTRRALARHDVAPIFVDAPEMRDEGLAGFLGTDAASVAKLHIQSKRFLIYHRYLGLHKTEIGQVLLSDVRDVFFQRPPFDFAHEAETLCCAIEDRTIGTCEGNRPWVLEAVRQEGLDRVAACAVSCSGTTIGSVRCMQGYLAQMVALMIDNPTSVRGVDQGFHNYVVHGGLVPKPVFYSNRDGPFLTLHGFDDWTLSEAAEVLLPSGPVAHIVHQYNRHPELVALAERRFSPSWLQTGSLKLIKALQRAF